MAKTIEEIAEKVLREIGRLPAGQVATASQVDTVKDAYSGLYEELLNNSLVDWSSIDDIPEYATYSVISMLAGRVSGEFGVPDIWSQNEIAFKRNLSQQLASPYVPQPTQFEAY